MFKQVKALVVSKAVLETAAVLVRGNTTDVKEAQVSNAVAPTDVTLAGMTMLVRPDCLNAVPPIETSCDPLPKLTVAKDAQPSKALS